MPNLLFLSVHKQPRPRFDHQFVLHPPQQCIFYILQGRLNSKYSEQYAGGLPETGFNTMKAQDEITEHCMFAISCE